MAAEGVVMARKATIGPEIHQQVTKLVTEGKSRTEAFSQIATERGQTAGAVSANFYRVARAQRKAATTNPARKARAQKATPTPRRVVRPRVAPVATATPRPGHTNTIDELVGQIVALTSRLMKLVEQRDAQLRALLP
jgi:hypothetical protein